MLIAYDKFKEYFKNAKKRIYKTIISKIQKINQKYRVALEVFERKILRRIYGEKGVKENK